MNERSRLLNFEADLDSYFVNIINVITCIPRMTFSCIVDLALVPFAGMLLVLSCVGYNFNPTVVKKNKIPTILIHGSGFNESEWIVGRYFLNKEEFGSVFSFNLDKVLGNDSSMGIGDHADKIRTEIKRISDISESTEVVLIGHSMGGMVSGYYAENYAYSDNIIVKHVITIGSPWQGTPTLNVVGRNTKRHREMTVQGYNDDDPNFRANLVSQCLTSEREGRRCYYNIWSSTDLAVPCDYGRLTSVLMRQLKYTAVGHYAIIAYPCTWYQIIKWLEPLY